MIATLLSVGGGAVGGLMRLVPAFLKSRSDSAEREHEYRMAKLQLEVDQARTSQEIDLQRAKTESVSIAGEMAAYREAIRGQSQVVGVRWVDAVSATVRPFITYWWQALFTFYKVSIVIWAWGETDSLLEFAGAIWTEKDWGILSMILGFWFVDRAIRRTEAR